MLKVLPFSTASDICTSAAHAQLLSPKDAQSRCNFILFVSGDDRFQPISETCSCRPEAVPGRIESQKEFATEWTNANPSSYRAEYLLSDGTRFRVKQFLFDWAPPYAGQPNLWKSATRAHELSNGNFVWIGTDYKDREGACAELCRTMIELSVIEGALKDTIVHEFYDSLVPVDDVFLAEYRNLAFHEVGYWQRFRPQWLKVPFSLWKPIPFKPYAMDHWVAADANALQLLVGSKFPYVVEGYVPETLGFYSLGTTKEAMDLKFQCAGDPWHGLRLHFRYLIGSNDKPASLTQDYCRHERVFVKGTYCVDIAYLDEFHGPFEYRIVNTRKRTELLAMFSPFKGHTETECTKLIGMMLEANDHDAELER
jgi:hypothetical protein